jgi:hypothetical protein
MFSRLKRSHPFFLSIQVKNPTAYRNGKETRVIMMFSFRHDLRSGESRFVDCCPSFFF